MIELRRPHVVGLGGTLRPWSTSRRVLECALAAAEEAGATTDILDVDDLDLPLYRPGLPLEAYGASAARLIATVRSADAMIWSTSAYHGSLAGVTKNALDFLEFLSKDPVPYLDGKPVGLISTAAGDIAAVNAANAMVNIAHALRATVAPLLVAVPQASNLVGSQGEIIDAHWAGRLQKLGGMIAGMAETRATAAHPLLGMRGAAAVVRA